MELLKTIGLSEEDVKKISPEMAKAISQLESISQLAEQKDAAQNIKDTYKSLYSQVEKYMLSPEFSELASKKGKIIPAAAMAEKEIVIEDMPKVKTLQEIVAEKHKKKSEPVVEPAVEPAVEEVVEEVVEKVPTLQDIATKKKTVEEKLFGFVFKGTKSGEMTGREYLSMLLAYGGSDEYLGIYEDSKGVHYRLDLPKSLAQAVISLSITSENSQYNSIQSVWAAYAQDVTATISVVGEDEKLLEQLISVVGDVASLKLEGELSPSELANDKFNQVNYTVVNEIYSRSLSGDTYHDIQKKIKQSWEAKVESDSSWSVNLPYGVNYADYVYRSAESYYGKGGESIVVQKYTFFVPKGLKKVDWFAETGGHLDILPIKTKDFEKNIEIGKTYQAQSSNFDKALSCRILGESRNGKLYVASEKGDFVYINLSAYSYFRKYYDVNIELKLSSETIVVYSKGAVVGVMPTTKLSSVLISGVFDIQNLKTELRNIDSNAFDFMVSSAQSMTEQTEAVIEKVEEIKVDESQDALKAELTLRLETMQDLYDDAVEEGENQSMIDEMALELETLKDLLED